MASRYYFNIIQMTINGENRTQPSAYDDLDSAMAKYHKTVGSDIASEQVIGYVAQVYDNDGLIHVNEKWGTMEKPIVEPIEETESV